MLRSGRKSDALNGAANGSCIVAVGIWRSDMQNKAPWTRVPGAKVRGPEKKPKRRVRAQSKKQAKLSRAWHTMRGLYLAQFPWCHCEGCPRQATEVHHMRGRGRYLLDTRTFMAVCADCHRKIHNNVGWAMEKGYMLSRLAKG